MRSRTYRFTKKDPVCDEIMSMVDQVGLRGKQHIGKIATLATKAHGTIEGILYGDTCRPQNATIMSIATALGFERKWVSAGKMDFDAELIAAKAFIKAERKRMSQETPRPAKKKKRAKGKPSLRLVKAA